MNEIKRLDELNAGQYFKFAETEKDVHDKWRDKMMVISGTGYNGLIKTVKSDGEIGEWLPHRKVTIFNDPEPDPPVQNLTYPEYSFKTFVTFGSKNDQEIADHLTAMGIDGWELVKVLSTYDHNHYRVMIQIIMTRYR